MYLCDAIESVHKRPNPLDISEERVPQLDISVVRAIPENLQDAVDK